MTPTEQELVRAYNMGFCLRLSQKGLRPSQLVKQANFKWDDEVMQWLVSRPAFYGAMVGLPLGALYGLHAPEESPSAGLPKQLAAIQKAELANQLRTDAKQLRALARSVPRKDTKPSPYGI